MQYDDTGYSLEANVRRARYKLALSQRMVLDAEQEARAIQHAALRNEWLHIAREAKRDSRHWLIELRRANAQAAV